MPANRSSRRPSGAFGDDFRLNFGGVGVHNYSPPRCWPSPKLSMAARRLAQSINRTPRVAPGVLREWLLTRPDLISANSCERHKPLNGSRWPGRGKRVKAGEICNALAAALLGGTTFLSLVSSAIAGLFTATLSRKSNKDDTTHSAEKPPYLSAKSETVHAWRELFELAFEFEVL